MRPIAIAHRSTFSFKRHATIATRKAAIGHFS